MRGMSECIRHVQTDMKSDYSTHTAPPTASAKMLRSSVRILSTTLAM